MRPGSTVEMGRSRYSDQNQNNEHPPTASTIKCEAVIHFKFYVSPFTRALICAQAFRLQCTRMLQRSSHFHSARPSRRTPPQTPNRSPSPPFCGCRLVACRCIILIRNNWTMIRNNGNICLTAPANAVCAVTHAAQHTLSRTSKCRMCS